MASPKHLWSGDWEEEASTRTPPPVEPVHPGYVVAPEPEPGPEPAGPERRPSRRALVSAAAVLVVLLVVVGVVLAVTLGGSKSKTPKATAQAPAQATTPLVQPPSGGQGFSTPTQTTPQQSTPQQSTPAVTQPNVVAGPTYDWLGMQINLTADGVTVGALSPGGAADLAGVDPGDVIVAVNTSQISTIAQLQSAAKHIKLGQHFTLIVDRGSTPVTLTATLTGRPSRQ